MFNRFVCVKILLTAALTCGAVFAGDENDAKQGDEAGAMYLGRTFISSEIQAIADKALLDVTKPHSIETRFAYRIGVDLACPVILRAALAGDNDDLRIYCLRSLTKNNPAFMKIVLYNFLHEDDFWKKAPLWKGGSETATIWEILKEELVAGIEACFDKTEITFEMLLDADKRLALAESVRKDVAATAEILAIAKGLPIRRADSD